MIGTKAPITISAAATERINELGFREELEEMLEHAQMTIPDLVRMEVTYTSNDLYAPEDPVELAAIVTTTDTDAHVRIMYEWDQWEGAAFPAETSLYFTFITATEAGHAV